MTEKIGQNTWTHCIYSLFTLNRFSIHFSWSWVPIMSNLCQCWENMVSISNLSSLKLNFREILIKGKKLEFSHPKFSVKDEFWLWFMHFPILRMYGLQIRKLPHSDHLLSTLIAILLSAIDLVSAVLLIIGIGVVSGNKNSFFPK